MNPPDCTDFELMIEILKDRDTCEQKANRELIEAVAMRNTDAMAVASSKLQQIDGIHDAVAKTKEQVQKSPPELRLMYLFMAGFLDVNQKKPSDLNFVEMLFSHQESAENSNAVVQQIAE